MIPNIKDYRDRVAKQLISIQAIDGENFALATKQFSAIDGSELPAQVFGVTISEVDKAIADKQVEIDELKVFKEDLAVVK